MTRLEENRMVIDKMIKREELKPTGTYEEIVTFQLGTIATMLADILDNWEEFHDNNT